ncbi:MAG: nucleotidyltransferase family protein [bacterium]
MKAMILAAGLGTRLKPLTDERPKALVPFNGKPLLEHVITKLISQGFYEIIINVHHFAEQVIDYVSKKNSFGIRIEISDERDKLLDTGGGVKKASWFFDDGKPFLVHNVDIISDTDLTALFRHHVDKEEIATLSVRERKSSRYLLFDDDNTLCGWKNVNTGEIKLPRQTNSTLKELAFSGIQILSPQIFNFMPDVEVFSSIDLYLGLAARFEIKGLIDQSLKWIDAGKKP